MPWLLSIDTGGTFTDCVATSPEGRTVRVKVLSSSAVRARVQARPDARTIIADWAIPPDTLAGCTLAPLGPARSAAHALPSILTHAHGRITLSADLGADALSPGATLEVRSPWQPPILAARIATATPATSDLPPIHMRLATTRGTNALLERRGHPPALFITRGFGDLLDIGDQTRPDLFALDIVKPAPLHACAIEVTERLAVDGSILTPLDLEDLRPRAAAALAAGHTTAAVALLHAWINPAHEHAVAALLRQAGFSHVCTSADLSPLIGFLPRTQSAVVNAYLARVVGDYLAGVEQGLGPQGRLLVMSSAGGLTRSRDFRPKDSLLSGPAGGLLGAAAAAHDAGRDPGAQRHALERIITFDMGGTSTDVARCASTTRREFPLTREHRVADARILAPAVAVESVAAGGGSICSFQNGELRVGPESAGASPGPACYGAGGPLTVTDCHVLLGRVAVQRFAIPLDIAAARGAAVAVLDRVNAAAASPLSLEALLEGFLALADERMADAVRRISIRQGEDPSSHALLAFGGAGGLHACAMAERLNVSTVIIPPDAGLLSARGLAVATLQRTAQQQVLRCLDNDPSWLGTILSTLELRATLAAAEEGIARDSIAITRREVTARILGQTASFDLPADDLAALPRLFRDAYTRTFGHPPPARPIEVESLLVVASCETLSVRTDAAERPVDGGEADATAARRPITQRLFAEHAWHEAPIITPDRFTGTVPGPAILAEAHATTFVPPGWSATRAHSGAMILRAAPAAAASARPISGEAAVQSDLSEVGERSSPIALELFIASLSAIAQDMGEMLRRTALSVNVKERLDFSCAILSPDGQLLVNAPHIPVHLGALGLCVRALQRSIDMAPGDTVITNHPAYGGSHLPDITLVSPIHADGPDGPRLIGYAASRAHHAELGGIKPGSMPPGATRLAQEAVVIPPMHLVRDGVHRFETLARHLAGAPHPTRALEHNLADVRAALAANLHGARALAELFTRTGPDLAMAHCRALTGRAETRVRAALARIAPGDYHRADALDDSSPIAVTITIPSPEAIDARAVIDFTGSAPIHRENFNATSAITTAATLYVLRLLVDEPMPLNEGMLRAVDLRIPEGTILNPGNAWTGADGPAVAAGNVETSQRIVDVLLLALGLAAASQGTMNNLAFGNDTFGFYETICGGAGATPNRPGASAVHTHMTNTRITDVEIFESRLPARVVRFAIRPHSGGQGFHRGGDGAIRELEFLVPVTCSLLAQRRSAAPPGLHGGSDGEPGRAWWRPRHAGETGNNERVCPLIASESGAGWRLVIETPGGGGWGRERGPN